MHATINGVHSDVAIARHGSAAFEADYLLGLSPPDERMLILMDIDQLMSSSDMGLIEQVASTV